MSKHSDKPRSASTAPAPASPPDAAASEPEEQLFLSFAVAGLGTCVLPIEAVQFVAEPDGPCRRVPGRGGRGSRFLGLVSVRGQVQLLFDLTSPQPLAPVWKECVDKALPANTTADDPSLTPAAPPASAAAGASPIPAATSAESALIPDKEGGHLIVAQAADARTLALRVLPPLRLLRRASDSQSPLQADEVAPLVRSSFHSQEGQVQVAWLIDTETLFTCLEGEVADG